MGAWVECGWTPAQKDLQNFPASLLTWLLRHCTSHIIHIMENPRVFTWQDVKCSHCLPTKGTSKARTFSQAREFRWEEFQEALGRFFRNTCKKCEIHRNPSKSYSTCSMEGIARNMVNHSSHIRFSAAAPQLPGNALCGFFARLLLLQIGGGCLVWHSHHMLCLIEEVCHRRNPSQMYGMPKKMDEWIFTILVFFLLLYR